MTLKTLIRVIAALALGGGSAIAGAGAASATETPVTVAITCENVKGTPIHSVNSDIVNRVDTGVGGHHWALDTFKRHADVYVIDKHDAPVLAKVEVTSYTYLVCGVDTGSFVTQGSKSPQKSLPMVNAMKGSFSGKWSLKVEAPSEGYFVAPTNTNTLSTSEWIDKLWSQGDKPEAFTDWSWTYSLCEVNKRFFNDVKWINKNSGNLGDIRTNKWCPKPSPSTPTSTVTPTGSNTQPAGGAQTPDSGTPSLPVTGSKTIVVAVVGVLALLTGVVILFAARRRRVRFEA